jgi:CDP-diacylglycerol---glycerol-3-phosphate 3-phosphatidyltransferase
MGWANRITLARAVLTVAVWVLLAVAAPHASPAAWFWAFGLFVATAVTDFVDGAVARRFGQVSVFGRIADPLVDKLLVLGTMVLLLGLDGVPAVLPAWAVATVVAREVLVTALRGAVEGRGVSFHALPLGKGKMVLQCTAVGCVLLRGGGVHAFDAPLLGTPWNVTHLAVALAVLLTVVSGVAYAVRALRLLARG